MDTALRQEIVAILDSGQDITIATLRKDGWPQATVVSYASDGLSIYFGCDGRSQKAVNLANDDRLSATVTLPYGHWNEIRGLSLAGRARRVTDAGEMARIGALFSRKFAQEIGQYLSPDVGALALFQITPEVVSVLDYRKGFGHTDLVQAKETAGAA